MAGFRTLTAGLWQVKVCGIEEGPTGTIQTTFIANEVSCVNHLYTVFVVSHQDRISLSTLVWLYHTIFTEALNHNPLVENRLFRFGGE